MWVLPFCQDRMAAAPHLEVLNPFYPGNKAKSRISWKKIHEEAVEKNGKKSLKKDKKNCEKRLKTVKKDEKRRKNSESGKKRWENGETAKNCENGENYSGGRL